MHFLLVPRLRSLLFIAAAALIGAPALTFSAVAADNTEAFEAKIKSGFEVGLVLEKIKSRDGQVGIIWTARKKTLKPATWPVLMTDFHYIGTVAEGEGDGFTSENWIVSLAEKKRLALVKWGNDDSSPFHPDDHRSDLSAAWSAETDGARVGFLVFSSDNKSYGAQVLSIDRGTVKATNLVARFDEAATRFAAQQKTWRANKEYQTLYRVTKTGLEEHPLPRGGTAYYQIGFTTSVDRDRASTPSIEGTIHLRVTSLPTGNLETEIVRVTPPGTVVKYAPADSAPTLAPTAPKTTTSAAPAGLPTKAPATLAEFTDLRLAYNKITDGDAWKHVDEQLPTQTKGQRHYVRGWYVGTQLRMLMHVDAATKDDQATTFYYFYDGALTSVFERRKGAATQISEVADASETYNFIGEKLVSWKRTPIEGSGDGFVSPKDGGFADQGKQVVKEAIRLAQPIYRAIKAN